MLDEAAREAEAPLRFEFVRDERDLVSRFRYIR